MVGEEFVECEDSGCSGCCGEYEKSGCEVKGIAWVVRRAVRGVSGAV